MKPQRLLPDYEPQQLNGAQDALLVGATEPLGQSVAQQFVVGLPDVSEQLQPILGSRADVVIIEATDQPAVLGLGEVLVE